MSAVKALSQKDMGSNKIINLADGTTAQEAATKAMVDAAQAFAISRANHTGSQIASTISNFDTQVRTSKITQMAVPTAGGTDPLSINGSKVTNVLDPTTAQDAATKNYVDNALSGLVSGQTLKGAVRVASTSNVVIATPGATIDGITMASGDVFLATAQTTTTENGPYVWNGAATPATRATNFDLSAEAVLGSYWLVREGTKADSFALLTNDTAITLGTTVLTFSFISVAGAAIGRFSATSPAISGGATWTVTHNLNSQDVHAIVRRTASPYDVVDVYLENATVNTVAIKPDVAMTLAEYTCIVKY